MNVHGLHGCRPPWEQNSWVVFDIPIESSAMRPEGLGFPSVSRGWMASARASPAAACTGGGTLRPPGYSPPSKPR